MNSVVAIAQCRSSADPEDNLQKAEGFCREGYEKNVQFTVFPEYFMTYYPMDRAEYYKRSQSLDGSFVREMKKLSVKYAQWILFGMNERPERENGGKCFNTAVLIDDSGTVRSCYRKAHLFDAFSWRESEDTMPGDALHEPVDTPFGKIGLGICYDLRFPEPSRIQALKGADMLVYPSAWVDGLDKFMQWETLLRARAIENGVFVIGCCHYSEEHYMGRSLAFDPSGKKIAEGGSGEELAVLTIDTEKAAQVKKQVPSLKNRRTDLYDISKGNSKKTNQ